MGNVRMLRFKSFRMLIFKEPGSKRADGRSIDNVTFQDKMMLTVKPIFSMYGHDIREKLKGF